MSRNRALRVMDLTEEHIELMEHACGVNSKAPFSRDYFAATPDSAYDRAWALIAKRGYAEVRKEPDKTWTPYRIYGVTDKGKALLKTLDVSLDEGKTQC